MPLLLIFNSSAFSMDRDVRTVLTAGIYGTGAGTILGMATLPFAQKVRGVFIGSSIGMYLGIATGIYIVTNRNNPDNPINQIQQPEEGYSETRLYKFRNYDETPLPLVSFTIRY